MALHWRLDLINGVINGGFIVVDAPSMAQHKRVQAHYRELRAFLITLSELNINSNLPFDVTIYPRVEPYYRAIASLLNPVFNPDYVVPESRYRFFIAGELFNDSRYPEPIPALSGLEQLMGMTIPAPSQPPGRNVGSTNYDIQLTSGDVEIDLMAELLLAFKEQAIALAQNYPMEYLSKLVAQASDRQAGPDVIRKRQQERDRQLFEANAARISQEFQRLGGYMPPS